MLFFALDVSAQPVPTVTLSLQSVGAFTLLDGVVQPVRQSTVAAQLSGRVVSLHVKAGDKVNAGQLLITIDGRETSLEQQRAQAQIDQAQADLRDAEANLHRTKDLQSQGFVSQAVLDTAQARYQSAKAQRAQAHASFQQSKLAQSFTQVTAPFEGWVLQTDVQAGDLAFPGKTLLIIYAPFPLRVAVQIPSSRLSQLAALEDVQVNIGDAFSGVWMKPTARSLIPASDPVSQTTEWRLDLPPVLRHSLVPGQRVRVKLKLGQSSERKVLTVPDQAVVRRGELTAVYVQAGDTFILRAIRLGQSFDAHDIEVLAGLKVGDVVALDTLRAASMRTISKKSNKAN